VASEYLSSLAVLEWQDVAERLQEVSANFILSIPAVIVAILVVLLFHLAGKGIRLSVRRLVSEKRRRRNLALVMGRLAHGTAIVLGVLIAAVVVFPNFTPTAALQFLGIGSVAIGFAFRDVLQNYLAGMLLLLTEPFRVGDQIVVKGYEGTVQDIQTRATLLKTYDGRRVVIPNAELFTSSVLVNTAFALREIELEVGIGYGDDIRRARQVILDALIHAEHLEPHPPPKVLVAELAPSAVVLRVRWWVRPPRIGRALDSRSEAITLIKQALQAAGIDLPFPTRQVLFHDQTEQTDGDRRRQREGWPAGPGAVPRPRPVADRSTAPPDDPRPGEPGQRS
jgi:small conductance mechanosensitive channel